MCVTPRRVRSLGNTSSVALAQGTKERDGGLKTAISETSRSARKLLLTVWSVGRFMYLPLNTVGETLNLFRIKRHPVSRLQPFSIVSVYSG